MAYDLGIDVGTTFTAAAISRDGVVEVVPLTTYSVSVPSVIFAAGHELLFGGAAERRGAAQPQGLAREFKRRVGDPVPLMLSGSPYHADRLTALMAQWATAAVAEQIGGPADRVVITHPANWTEYQLGTLRNALRDVGLGEAELISEPAAAATDYAAVASLAPDSTVLVYDLGGGTFDVALLRREGATFEHVVEPAGIERLGGIDFDEAVFQFAIDSVPREVLEAARQRPEAASAITQLRRRCVDAKEALSSDAASDIPVMLPDYTSTVRITRAEFESMIRPSILQTIELVQRTMERGQLDPGAIHAALLVGGSSRIPLVSQLVGEHLDVPVRIDAHPKLVTARGAARKAAAGGPAGPVESDGGGSRRKLLLVAGGVAAAAAIAAGAFVVLGGDDDPSDAGATTTPSAVTGAVSSTVPASSVAPTTEGATAQAGAVLWKAQTDGPLASVKGPAVEGDAVVFASQDGSVYRVDRTSGAVVWEAPISELIFSSPAIAGDSVVVGSPNGLFSLALADGSVRWNAAPTASMQSSPFVDGDTVYVGSDDGNVYAVDLATGTSRWTVPLDGSVSSSPVVDAGVLYVATQTGTLFALDAVSGAVRWQTFVGPVYYSTPAVTETTVFIGSNDRHLYALDKATGEVDWRFATADLISGSPTVADGVVYIGGFDDNVYAVDAQIGGERWRHDTGNDVFSSPKVADGTVYVGSHARVFWALSTDDGSVQWRFRGQAIFGGTPDGIRRSRVRRCRRRRPVRLSALARRNRWREPARPGGVGEHDRGVVLQAEVRGVVIGHVEDDDGPHTRLVSRHRVEHSPQPLGAVDGCIRADLGDHDRLAVREQGLVEARTDRRVVERPAVLRLVEVQHGRPDPVDDVVARIRHAWITEPADH